MRKSKNPELSAGILMYRFVEGDLQVLLAHPGGPFWRAKDLGAWTIPKGLFDPGEDPLEAARREFREETGFEAVGPFLPLTPLKQRTGKVVYAWAAQGNAEPSLAKSNRFTMEWPKGTGMIREFPEIDRVEWFVAEEAAERLVPGQRGFIGELRSLLGRK